MEEPLDANAWIRTIESKFTLLHVPCSEENKARFAAQQLRESAHLWCDHYSAMLQAGHVVIWEEFRNAFRSHHIPEGLMDRKLNEFLALTQGNRTVVQYAQAFNDLSRYAGYHADTDAKKRVCFYRGLNTKLKDRLNPIIVDTYNELVNLAITQEDCFTAHQVEKKRKAPAGPSIAQPPIYHLVQNNPPQNSQRSAQQRRWVIRPQQEQQNRAAPSSQQQQQRFNAHHQAMTTAVLDVEDQIILLETARKPDNKIKAKDPTKIIRTRTRGRPVK